MTIVLRQIPRQAGDAILVGERPADVRVADDYPTEFSAGVAQAVGTEGQFTTSSTASKTTSWSARSGAAFVDKEGTIEIGYAVSSRSGTAATRRPRSRRSWRKAREASEVRRVVAHTPLDRPESGRALEKAGFAMVREMDDTDEAGNVRRVKEWELTV